jgi:GT2 family glycosyltransferase/peptidoglycan/xylan/chitin deacetylase (PgdA/CDA1 family)
MTAVAKGAIVVRSRTNRVARPSLATCKSETTELITRRAIAEVQARAYDVDHMPDIDLSIVTYNSHAVLPSFFDSLLAQSYPISRIHLLICQHSDNIKDDEVINEFIQRHGDRLKSISRHHVTNRGFGAGHNTNLQAARTEFFFVSNVDLQFEPDTLPILIHLALNAHPSVACFEARQSPLEHPKFYDPSTFETSWCSGCALLARTEAYRQIGGFDETFFMYGEDVDLSVRLRSRQLKLVYCPWAVVRHCPDPNRRPSLNPASSIKTSLILNSRHGGPLDIVLRIARSLYLMHARTTPQDIRKDARRGLSEWVSWLCTKYSGSRRSFMEALRARILFHPMNNGFEYEWRRPFDLSVSGRDIDRPLQARRTSSVSIIIRYSQGRQSLFEHALRTACFQTRQAEIVVIEDGVAEVGRIVELYQAAGFNIVHVSVDKIGRAAAASFGLSIAAGKYVCFLDDDDYLFLDHIEVLLRRLERPRAKPVDAVAGWAVWARSTRSRDRAHDVKLELPPWYAHEYTDQNLGTYNYFPIQSVLFGRADAIRIGRFDTSLDLLEDWNFFARLLHGKNLEVVRQTTSVFRIPHSRLEAASRKKKMEACYADVHRKVTEARRPRDRGPKRTLRLVYHRVGTSAFDPFGMFVENINFRDQIATLLDRCKLGLFGEQDDQLGLELHFDDAFNEIHEQFEIVPQLAGMETTVFVPTRVIEGPPTLVTEVVRAAFAEDPVRARRALAGALSFANISSESSTDFALYTAVDSFLKKCDKPALEESEHIILRAFPHIAEKSACTMTRAELADLAQAGTQLGGHGHSHRSLTALQQDELSDELASCRRILKEIAGQEPDAFAFPYGNQEDFSADVVRAVKASGFQRAFWSGGQDYGAGSEIVLGRFQVGNLDKCRFADQLDAVIGLMCSASDASDEELRFRLARTPIFVKSFRSSDRPRLAALS